MSPWCAAKDALRRGASRLVTHFLNRDAQQGNSVLTNFIVCCQTVERPRVLELGTRRSDPTRSTRHDDWLPHASEYLGTDLAAGLDVDIVADVHRLTRVTGEEQFDAIISCSTFEHFKYPHLAAHEIMKALRVGGFLFIQSHQTFPLHAFPFDYFRFSTEAMAGLFGTRMGLRVHETGYEFKSKISSPEGGAEVGSGAAYLNVCLLGQKEAPTPDEYVYEIETP